MKSFKSGKAVKRGTLVVENYSTMGLMEEKMG